MIEYKKAFSNYLNEYQPGYKLSDYLNAINFSKVNLLDGDDLTWEKKFPPYVINRCLSQHIDAIMQSNEMNMHSHLENKIQYDYLLNSTRSRRRFSKWFKVENDSDIELIKEHYNVNNRRAREYKSLMSQSDIESLRQLWSTTENPT